MPTRGCKQLRRIALPSLNCEACRCRDNTNRKDGVTGQSVGRRHTCQNADRPALLPPIPLPRRTRSRPGRPPAEERAVIARQISPTPRPTVPDGHVRVGPVVMLARLAVGSPVRRPRSRGDGRFDRRTGGCRGFRLLAGHVHPVRAPAAASRDRRCEDMLVDDSRSATRASSKSA